MDEVAIQDRMFGAVPCFGCGPLNSRGLRLKSYERSGGVIAEFMPWPEHDNGGGFLNGGIISTLLDCHSGAAVHVLAHERGWMPAPGAALAYVTAGIDVRFLRPSPLLEPVTLAASVVEASEDQITCRAELWYAGKLCATGEALWKRWRPR